MLKDMMGKAIKTGGVDAAWNTGREYSTDKQRMSARVLEDGRVAFCDIDRSIQGLLKTSYAHDGKSDPVALAAFVMREYDENRYASGFYELHSGENHEMVASMRDHLRSAAESIGVDGLRIPESHQLPGVADAALSVLRAYPSDAKVADFYDVDDEFASALGALVGASFEYPDHSHKAVGNFISGIEKHNAAQSVADAEVLARSRGSAIQADPYKEQTYVGKVLGLTSAHAVISLGRSALIVRQSDLSQVPSNGADVSIAFSRGKGVVSEQSVSKEMSR